MYTLVFHHHQLEIYLIRSNRVIIIISSTFVTGDGFFLVVNVLKAVCILCGSVGSRETSLSPTGENSLVSWNSPLTYWRETQWWWTMRRRREARGRRRRCMWKGSRRLDEDVEALDMVLLNVEN